MRMIFATVVSARHFSAMFTDLGVNDRLLSYAELLYAPPDFLPAFVTTGRHPVKIKGRRLRDETWDSQIPRVVLKKPGKEKPESRVVNPRIKHWQSSTFIKRKSLLLIAKLEAYERDGVGE